VGIPDNQPNPIPVRVRVVWDGSAEEWIGGRTPSCRQRRSVSLPCCSARGTAPQSAWPEGRAHGAYVKLGSAAADCTCRSLAVLYPKDRPNMAGPRWPKRRQG